MATTKPASKIVQIMQIDPDHKLIVLCQDGSVWWLDMNGTFTLVVQMTGTKYL